MFVFKGPKGYGFTFKNGLIQFNQFGLFSTVDEELIEHLNNDTWVTFLGEGDEFMVVKPEGIETPQSEETDEAIRTLRTAYFEKFNKKPSAKRTIAELEEKLKEAE